MKQHILKSVEEVIQAAQLLQNPKSLQFIEAVSSAIVNCLRNGGKLLIAGNGGSLCDAMHFAEELTGIYRLPRKALAAIALADPGHLSCMANDMGYETVFARSLEALGKPGDLFILLTTSGNSANLIRAIPIAQASGLQTIAFLGKTGGQLKGICDFEWIVEGFTYSDRIQEVHMAAIHIIVEMVERELFAVCSGTF